MEFNRVYAIVLRHLYTLLHSFDRLSDAFYWPTINLLLWGLTGVYVEKSSGELAGNIVMAIVAGIVFWLITWRAQYEISVSLLTDLWDKNLINIFVSPLKFSEWIFSFVILGLIKGMMSFLFAILVAFVLYKVQIFSFGFYLLPFIVLLMISGWWMGFFVSGVILRYGTKVQTLAWIAIMVISPFSAIYYPLSVLPGWAQTISLFVPTSYVFEGAREVVARGVVDPQKLYISLILNLIYTAISIIYLKKSFSKAREVGLIKSV